MRKKSKPRGTPIGTTGEHSSEAWTIVDVPSLHGMVKVSICGDLGDLSPMFYSGIHQMVQSLIRKDWDCGTVSITLSRQEDGIPEAYILVTHLDTTAT